MGVVPGHGALPGRQERTRKGLRVCRAIARSIAAGRGAGDVNVAHPLLPEIQAQLPPSMVLVHYSTLADRILIWTITASGAKLVERPIAERELARLIEQHRASIREHRENRDVNDRLYKLLIRADCGQMSAAAMVVLVPDGHLQQLSFATLRHPSTTTLFDRRPRLDGVAERDVLRRRRAARSRSRQARSIGVAGWQSGRRRVRGRCRGRGGG